MGLKALAALELRSLYGINRILHTKTPKEKQKALLLLAALLMLLVMACFYVGSLTYALVSLGLETVVPSYLGVIVSVLLLFFGIFKAGYRIFNPKSFDILSPLPLSRKSIVFSHFFGLYAEDLLTTWAICLPGVAVYGICAKPGFIFYLLFLLGSFFLPMIPLALSALIGTGIFAISVRMKHKNLVQTLLSLGIVIGTVFLSSQNNSYDILEDPEKMADMANTLSTLLGKFYPPILWFQQGVLGQGFWGYCLFLLLSAAVLVSVIALAALLYRSIVETMRPTAERKKKAGKIKEKSLLFALTLREGKRYFSSPVYVTNTILGPIFGAILGVAAAVVGMEKIQNFIPELPRISELLPFALTTVFCMMTTSCTSLSLEGNRFWVVKSLPVPTKTLFDSKILFNLALMVPFFLIAETALLVGIRPQGWDILWLLLIPLVTILFVVVFGITVNLKFHSFDWVNETEIVKQSAEAAFGGFAGPVLGIAGGVATFLAPAPYGSLAKGIYCLLLAGLTVFCYLHNNKAKLEEL